MLRMSPELSQIIKMADDEAHAYRIIEEARLQRSSAA
jgi:hypothetical protein